MGDEKIKFVISKIINVIFLLFILFAMIGIFFEKVFMTFCVFGFPFMSSFLCASALGYAEAYVGTLIFFALHFLSLIAIGVLPNIAYAKRIKPLRTITYLLIVPELLVTLIMWRPIAFLISILVILAVKYMIPFWLPYREKTIYDWEW